MGIGVVINQGSKPQDIPDWEKELWATLCSNEGAGCRIYNQCQASKDKLNCVVNSAEQFLQMPGHLPQIEKDNSIVSLIDCRLYQLIKLLAQQCLDRAGITSPPVPDEIVHLIHPEKQIEIRQLPFKRYHGAVWHIDDRWIIYLNSNDTTGRRRVTLFHEYFHILASCNVKTSFNDTQITYSEMNNKACLVTEMMADAFAANLLIPQTWLENNFPKTDDIKLIAETCNVEYDLTYLRFGGRQNRSGL